MPDPTEERINRTGEIPTVPRELPLPFEPMTLLPDYGLHDSRSDTGVYPVAAEASDDGAARDADTPFYFKD